MKPLFLLLLICCTGIVVDAQTDNPFSSIGKKGEIKTAYGNRFVETFDYDSIQRIGTVLINIRTKKIVLFLDPKKVFTKYSDNSASSRWMSIDPLAAKYINMSPYAAMGNNPIIYADADGRELIFCGDAKLLDTYAKMLSERSGRQITINSETGVMSMGVANKSRNASPVLAKLLSDAAETSTRYDLRLVNNSNDTWIDNYQSNTIDVGDLKTLGRVDDALLAGALGHFIAEVTYDPTYNKMDMAERRKAYDNYAHAAGLAKEGEIVGGILGIGTNPRQTESGAVTEDSKEQIHTYRYGADKKVAEYLVGQGITNVTKSAGTMQGPDGKTYSTTKYTIIPNGKLTQASKKGQRGFNENEFNF